MKNKILFGIFIFFITLFLINIVNADKSTFNYDKEYNIFENDTDIIIQLHNGTNFSFQKQSNVEYSYNYGEDSIEEQITFNKDDIRLQDMNIRNVTVIIPIFFISLLTVTIPINTSEDKYLNMLNKTLPNWIYHKSDNLEMYYFKNINISINNTNNNNRIGINGSYINTQRIDMDKSCYNIYTKNGTINFWVNKNCIENITENLIFRSNSYVIDATGGNKNLNNYIGNNQYDYCLNAVAPQLNSTFADNLVMWQSFDCNTGIDLLGKNNGTLGGGIVWNSTGGKYGGAFMFDSVNDQININSNMGLSSAPGVTFSAWVNNKDTASSNHQFRGIITDAFDDYVDLMLISNSNNYVFGTSSLLCWANSLSLTGWHQIVGTYDLNSLKLYFDGNIVTTCASSTPIPNENWVIGVDRNIGGRYFNGHIDEVRIYNRSLSADEVLANFNDRKNMFQNGATATYQNIPVTQGDKCKNITINSLEYYGGSYEIYINSNDKGGINIPAGSSGTYDCSIDNILNNFDLGIRNILSSTSSSTPEFLQVIIETQDITPPQITFSSPTPNNNNISCSRNIIINTSIIEQHIDTFKLNWNGVNTTYNVNGEIPNYWFAINKNDLTDGQYSYYSWANDTTNNINQTEVRNIIIDVNPPNIVLNKPEDNSVKINPLTFNCSVTDNDGVKNVSLKVWDEANNLVYSQTKTSPTNGSDYIFNIANNLSAKTGYKWNCFACSADVSCSNCQFNSQNNTFEVVNIPNITYISPTPDDNAVLCQNNFQVNTSIVGKNLNLFVFNLNGTNYTSNSTNLEQYNATQWYFYPNAVNLNSVIYSYYIYVKDINGYSNQVERTITITNPPTVQWISENNQQSSNPNPTLKFNITSDVLSSINYNVYIINNTDGSILEIENGNALNGQETNYKINYQLPYISNPTNYSFIVEGISGCGINRNSTTLNYSLVPPVVYLMSPSENSVFNGNTTEISFVFNVSDPSYQTLNCSLYIDNILEQTNSTTIRYTPTTFIVDKTFTSGNHNWVIKCINEINTEANNTRNFKILCYNYDGNGNCLIKSNENCGCINEALNDNTNCINKVSLNSSIINSAQSCVYSPDYFYNKVFDCQGHTIDGNNIDNTYGIYLGIRTNNTIKNCIITNFYDGIYLSTFSNNNSLINNTANNNSNDGIHIHYSSKNNTLDSNVVEYNNHYGISLYTASDYNTLINNEVHYNNIYGIYLYSSSNNIINTNNLCNNTNYDIYNDTSNFNNIGDNNIGSTSYNWNNTGTTGFTYSCGECSCNSCEDCKNKLNNNFCVIVKLTANINNFAGTCIDDPLYFTNKIFDCQGHTIDGDGSGSDYGIYLSGKQNNRIKNCIITDFYNGIYLDSSSNNNITNNTANLNTQYGIYLDSSNSNTLTYNSVSDKITLLNSNSNRVCDNTPDETNVSSGIGNKCNGAGCDYECYPVCFCGSCEECNNKLNDADCNLVKLNVSLNSLGTCINNPVNFNNKIFDCQGYTINGNNENNSYGIYLNSNQNNYIKNCIISNFDKGIYLNNTSNNTFYVNNIKQNNIGFDIYGGNDNITSNSICYNQNDFYINNANAFGNDNACEIPNGWNDTGKMGCSKECGCNCTSCLTCVNKLNQPNCNIVYLNNDITTNTNCINNPIEFNNKIFDCDNHNIKSTDKGKNQGIIIINKTNIQINKCVLDGFNDAIYVENSSSITLNYNEIINGNNGIKLYNNINNKLSYNLIQKNKVYGISENNSQTFLIYSNYICNNVQADLFSYSYNYSKSYATTSHTTGTYNQTTGESTSTTTSTSPSTLYNSGWMGKNGDKNRCLNSYGWCDYSMKYQCSETNNLCKYTCENNNIIIRLTDMCGYFKGKKTLSVFLSDNFNSNNIYTGEITDEVRLNLPNGIITFTVVDEAGKKMEFGTYEIIADKEINLYVPVSKCTELLKPIVPINEGFIYNITTVNSTLSKVETNDMNRKSINVSWSCGSSCENNFSYINIQLIKSNVGSNSSIVYNENFPNRNKEINVPLVNNEEKYEYYLIMTVHYKDNSIFVVKYYLPPITTTAWCSANPPLLGRDLHFYLFLAGVFVMLILLFLFSVIDWMWGIFIIGFYMLFNNLFNFFCFQYPYLLIVVTFLLGAAGWYFKGREIPYKV